jgi:hypothetical protein
MSWNVFRNNILRISDSPNSIRNIKQVARMYTLEYDNAIRRGRDIMNNISVASSDLSRVESLFESALRQGVSTNSSHFSLVNNMGTAVITYWSTVVMNIVPVPIIPAIGTVQNLLVTSNIINNSGRWNAVPSIPPSRLTSLMVDLFITTAVAHLTTVSGMITTMSIYPSTPPVTAPAIINWSGYIV